MTDWRIQATCSHTCRYTPHDGTASASQLYRRARERAAWHLFWSSLIGRSRTLFSLEQTGIVCQGQTWCDGTVRTVPIRQIRGSEGRAGDFDCNFDPIQDHTRERWLGIAAARQRGKVLPPVALVQVGSLYFVRDGHHRIPVARALGQKDIEATVEVWQVREPLPWDGADLVNQPSSQRLAGHVPSAQAGRAASGPKGLRKDGAWGPSTPRSVPVSYGQESHRERSTAHTVGSSQEDK